MLVPIRRSRSRPRRLARHRVGLWTEALEARRLLAAAPINVASGLTFASGLPLPGLASGQGLSTTAQTLPASTVSVAPASVATLFGPSTTGPSTTLSPLMNDSETAVATASEVARPTPGRSDRVQSIIEAPEVIATPHLVSPDAVEVIPGPEIQARPPAQAAPAQPPAEPAVPARMVAPAPVPIPAPEAVPEVSKEPMTFEVWDAALELVATDLTDDSPVSLTSRSEGAMAAGALLAAWGGWKYNSRFDGRSRKRPLAIAAFRTDDR